MGNRQICRRVWRRFFSLKNVPVTVGFSNTNYVRLVFNETRAFRSLRTARCPRSDTGTSNYRPKHNRRWTIVVVVYYSDQWSHRRLPPDERLFRWCSRIPPISLPGQPARVNCDIIPKISRKLSPVEQYLPYQIRTRKLRGRRAGGWSKNAITWAIHTTGTYSVTLEYGEYGRVHCTRENSKDEKPPVVITVGAVKVDGVTFEFHVRRLLLLCSK